jgi:hypothetical protein
VQLTASDLRLNVHQTLALTTQQGENLVLPWCAAMAAIAVAYAAMKWLAFGPGMPTVFATLLVAGAVLCVTAPFVRRRLGAAGLAVWCAVAAVLIAFSAGTIVGRNMDLGGSGAIVLFVLLAPPFAAAGVAVYRVDRPPSTIARTFPIALTVFVLMEIVSFVVVLALLVAMIPRIG